MMPYDPFAVTRPPVDAVDPNAVESMLGGEVQELSPNVYEQGPSEWQDYGAEGCDDVGGGYEMDMDDEMSPEPTDREAMFSALQQQHMRIRDNSEELQDGIVAENAKSNKYYNM